MVYKISTKFRNWEIRLVFIKRFKKFNIRWHHDGLWFLNELLVLKNRRQVRTLRISEAAIHRCS